VSVLLCSSQLAEVRNLYFENARIFLDSEEEKQFFAAKNDVLKFLERDEKHGFKYPEPVPNRYVS
jgi:hypothetical protein